MEYLIFALCFLYLTQDTTEDGLTEVLCLEKVF